MGEVFNVIAKLAGDRSLADHDLLPDTRAGRAWTPMLDLGAVVATVSLFSLSFPGGPRPELGWVALVPLGLALHRRNLRDAFALSFATGFFAWLVLTWWVVPAIALSSRSPAHLLWPLELGLCLVYALPYAAAGCVYSRMGWTRGRGGAVKGALACTSIGALLPEVLPGNLAHSQYQWPMMIQIVEIGGIALLLFTMYTVNYLVVSACVEAKTNLARAINTLALGALVVGGVAAYGMLRLHTIEALSEHPDTARVTVGVVQPNISIYRRDRSHWPAAMARLETMTAAVARGSPKPDLIVWPEIPVPLSHSSIPEDRARLDALADRIGIPLLITGYMPVALPHDAASPYYNVTELLVARQPKSTYRKRRLTPFSEYLPFEQEFPALRAWLPRASRYVPGSSDALFALPSGTRIIPLICYEALFPALARRGVRAGGELIVNPVNDAWLGPGRGAYVHLALAAFRSVELRVPMVRATNSGLSVVIDATGRFTPAEPQTLFAAATFIEQIPLPPLTSIYARCGDWFKWMALLLTLILVRNCRVTHPDPGNVIFPTARPGRLGPTSRGLLNAPPDHIGIGRALTGGKQHGHEDARSHEPAPRGRTSEG